MPPQASLKWDRKEVEGKIKMAGAEVIKQVAGVGSQAVAGVGATVLGLAKELVVVIEVDLIVEDNLEEEEGLDIKIIHLSNANSSSSSSSQV